MRIGKVEEGVAMPNRKAQQSDQVVFAKRLQEVVSLPSVRARDGASAIVVGAGHGEASLLAQVNQGGAGEVVD